VCTGKYLLVNCLPNSSRHFVRFFFSSRRRHTRSKRDWSSDVCSSDLMPGHIYTRGYVGVVTRSGTLGYEAASQMQALGVGITTSVGIGGDPINGSSFVDILALFEQDPETEAVMMIGEIGGPQEADAALFVK